MKAKKHLTAPYSKAKNIFFQNTSMFPPLNANTVAMASPAARVANAVEKAKVDEVIAAIMKGADNLLVAVSPAKEHRTLNPVKVAEMTSLRNAHFTVKESSSIRNPNQQPLVLQQNLLKLKTVTRLQLTRVQRLLQTRVPLLHLHEMAL